MKKLVLLGRLFTATLLIFGSLGFADNILGFQPGTSFLENCDRLLGLPNFILSQYGDCNNEIGIGGQILFNGRTYDFLLIRVLDTDFTNYVGINTTHLRTYSRQDLDQNIHTELSELYTYYQSLLGEPVEVRQVNSMIDTGFIDKGAMTQHETQVMKWENENYVTTVSLIEFEKDVFTISSYINIKLAYEMDGENREHQEKLENFADYLFSEMGIVKIGDCDSACIGTTESSFDDFQLEFEIATKSDNVDYSASSPWQFDGTYYSHGFFIGDQLFQMSYFSGGRIYLR